MIQLQKAVADNPGENRNPRPSHSECVVSNQGMLFFTHGGCGVKKKNAQHHIIQISTTTLDFALLNSFPNSNMVRTKQTARKFTGGRAPRKQLSSKARRNLPRQFHDHAGRAYTVLCPFATSGRSVQKLGIQLYLLGERTDSEIEAFAEKFIHCAGIEGWANASNYWPRVDAYAGFKTVEECIEHHRKEKKFRKAAIENMRRDAVAGLSEEAANEKLLNEIRGREPLPHIIPSWCPSDAFWREGDYKDRYRSWIIVVEADRLSWEDVVERGLLQVRFDLDVTPQMVTESWCEGVDTDSCLEKDKEGWVFVDWTGNEKSKPIDRRLLCVRDQPYRLMDLSDKPPEEIAKMMYGWETPGSDARLFDAWSSYTICLRDCTYRGVSCYACDNDEEHDLCEQDLDEHYFDEDGQCIACRRASEYRRRSKRIAAKKTASS
ncbi:unnamed protein product [Clonostachys byssicola]|uniref:Uncharacterized protein n=1 Tax=Clonostachys byssicola TaxID=160290 RepID=A0A9N9UH21_9HYPO|nr:unnamed protein product [Clonostachys byssicola]